jgi:hypothetical protein
MASRNLRWWSVAVFVVLVIMESLVASPAVSNTPRPDLVVRSMAVPNDAFVGRSVRITITILNKGLRVARRSKTGYYLSTSPGANTNDVRLSGTLSSQVTSSLEPSATWKWSGALDLPSGIPLGAYHLLVCVDISQRTKEQDERNCFRSRRELRIGLPRAPAPAPSGPGGQPDLPPPP